MRWKQLRNFPQYSMLFPQPTNGCVLPMFWKSAPQSWCDQTTVLSYRPPLLLVVFTCCSVGFHMNSCSGRDVPGYNYGKKTVEECLLDVILGQNGHSCLPLKRYIAIIPRDALQYITTVPFSTSSLEHRLLPP